MARALLTNNASTELTSSITNSDTTLLVAAGSVLPQPSGSDYAYLTISDESNIEIVKMTARSTNTLTVVRAQDGTSSHSFDSGATVSVRAVKALFDELHTAVDTKADSDTSNKVFENYTALTAQTTPASYAQVLYRSASPDRGGGAFELLTGDYTSQVSSDPGKGIYVPLDSDPTGATMVYRRVFDGVVDAAFYGFSTTASAADNTTALNRCLNYLRSVFAGGNITSAGEPPCAMKTGPGQFSVTSINATQIRSKGWRWDAYGTQLNCATDMAVVVDLTHSRGYTIRNLVIKGDETTPPLRGFQTGYMDGATSSGDYVLDNCHTYGKFEQTAYYNGGSEVTVLLKCLFRNTNSSTGSYSGIYDGMNLWGKYSAYLTPSNGDHMVAPIVSVSASATATITTSVAHGLSPGEKVRFFDITGGTNLDQSDNLWTVNTTPTTTTFTVTGTNGSSGTGGYCWRAQANSMVNHNVIETSFFKDNGGEALWLSSNVQSMRMTGYVRSPSADLIRYYFRPSLAALAPFSNEFEIACEGPFPSVFYLYEGESTTNTWNIGNFKFKDHGPQVTGSIFKTNASTSTFNFGNIDLQIAYFASTANAVTDTTARYRMQGKIATREQTLSGRISNIPKFYGDLYVTDPADVLTLPAGSYRIMSINFDGSDATKGVFKGRHDFLGGAGEITTGIDNEAICRVGDSTISAPYFRSSLAVLADDAVLALTVPGTVPAGILHIASTGANNNGSFWIRASASPNREQLTAGGTLFALTTGVLTDGTSDGTDTKFNISPHTDGKVYLKNRTGASVSIGYMWTGYI